MIHYRAVGDLIADWNLGPQILELEWPARWRRVEVESTPTDDKARPSTLAIDSDGEKYDCCLVDIDTADSGKPFGRSEFRDVSWE